MAMLQSNHGPVPETDLNAILLKDAIYNAVGLAAFELYDEVCCLGELIYIISIFFLHVICLKMWLFSRSTLMNGF